MAERNDYWTAVDEEYERGMEAARLVPKDHPLFAWLASKLRWLFKLI